MRGRPRKGSTTVVRDNVFQIRMTEEFFNELLEHAESKKMSVNEYVRYSTNNYVDFMRGSHEKT